MPDLLSVYGDFIELQTNHRLSCITDCCHKVIQLRETATGKSEACQISVW